MLITDTVELDRTILATARLATVSVFRPYLDRISALSGRGGRWQSWQQERDVSACSIPYDVHQSMKRCWVCAYNPRAVSIARNHVFAMWLGRPAVDPSAGAMDKRPISELCLWERAGRGQAGK